MRPAWPARLTKRAARHTARLLFVVFTAAGLTIAYGLSRSAPPDMCVFADYPAAAALAAPGAGAGGPGTRTGARPDARAGAPVVAQAAQADSGVPSSGDHQGGVLQVCAAVLAVLMLLALGSPRPRSRRFLYELPRALGPPYARLRGALARTAPSLATLQVLRV
ncbi:MAG: hypothetical protein GEV11_01265 [Streptosporangiales bacterium]|nr:hypothetical protein [Streptosporangiales bacterium]